MSDIVSVIIPVYNAEQTILRTLESAVGQTYLGTEIIVVDDCSTDGSLSLIKDFVVKNPELEIRVLEMSENAGVAKCRNVAIENSAGRYIAFLDSDDVWLPTKIARQVEFMQKHKINFCYTAYWTFNSDDERSERILFSVPEEASFKGLLKTCKVFTSTVVIDRKIWPKSGMVDWRARQDYITWLEIARAGTVMRGINTPLMIYETGGSGISRNKFAVARIQWQVYRQAMGLNILKSGYFFLHYMAFGSVKYLRQQS